jgi:Uma2 family endonuclease
MPQVKKAELIEGVVYLGSPVSVRHAKPDNLIQLWLGAYASRHPETEALTNATVILDPENTVQPDALLRRLPEHGGLSRVNEAGYLAGPPELIVEVAASSASIDLRDKRRAYCRNGVREYLVWLVAEARLEWFWKRTTTVRNCRTRKACCTAASSLASNCPSRRCWPATSPKSWRH